MKPPILCSLALAIAACFAVCAIVVSPRLTASEIAATHVVFEKATKMKKADTFLYLPLVAQSTKSDSPSARRLVDCRVFAEGKAGPLPVRGALRLELLGEIVDSSGQWTSDRITVPIEAGGKASFQPDEILSLVDQAQTDKAAPRFMRIAFDGGKGKKVSRLTVDCENRETGS